MEFQPGLNMPRVMHWTSLTDVHKIVSSWIGKYFWDECFLYNSSFNNSFGSYDN